MSDRPKCLNMTLFSATLMPNYPYNHESGCHEIDRGYSWFNEDEPF